MPNPSAGGVFLPDGDYNLTGAWNFPSVPTLTTGGALVGTTTTQTLSNKTLAATTTVSAILGDRVVKTAVKALTGAAINAGTGGVIAWQNPEGAAILILRALLYLTTVSTGACTLDIGVTATSATTSSDTLLDGIDATTTAPALSDSMNAALDSGANAKAQALASGKWVTIDEATGDATGLVGNLYIQYILA